MARREAGAGRGRVPADFDEADYLAANADVARAVASGQFESGRQHYALFGHAEPRAMRPGGPVVQADTAAQGRVSWRTLGQRAAGLLRWAKPEAPLATAAQKRQKLQRIRPILRTDMACRETADHFDFLSDELRQQFNIIDTAAVSSNNYDPQILQLIERHRDGLLLDCGAGKRSRYFDNVVNFEIAAYDSTDVRGVGEVLPFRDASFDAVISVAVLEHVKDPFRCAREIIRVLKPGGDLFCCVPFLQPYHGYPHHYYNMTQQGIRNLFEGALTNEVVSVPPSVLPIWSLTWMLSSWADGLTGSTRKDFLDMQVKDLLGSPIGYLQKPFVRELSDDKNLELASACVLTARKKTDHD